MYKKNKIIRLFLFLCIFQLSTFVFAQEYNDNANKIIVGTKEAPPFAIKNMDGSWGGISIDLWKQIAKSTNIDYEIKEFDLAGLLKAVQQKKIDVAVAALTITPEREKVLDFSHAYYVDGLGIALPVKANNSWLSAVRRFISFEFLSVIGALSIILLIVGYLGWYFEHRKNQEQFSPNLMKGLGDGFWWSAVTMTTVGYGDKAPKTVGGRILAIIWMFTSVIIISSFTAAITSAVTVSQLDTGINSFKDLPDVRVGTVKGSTSLKALMENKINFQSFDDLEGPLMRLKEGKLDAVVYDAPLLQYSINRQYQSELRVLPNTFVDQSYGLAFSSGHPLREEINQSLLEIIHSAAWTEILHNYLGSR